jgi:hypothetical protein
MLLQFPISLYRAELSTPQEQTLALQRIMQLLPQVNRDTLFVLLHFLGLVADNAEDKITAENGMFKKLSCNVVFL